MEGFPEETRTDQERWDLHVAASSHVDYTFWVREVDSGWLATEVETGVSGDVANNARNAIDSYWSRNSL